MKYDLRRPCPKCPFRTDVPGYLRCGRAAEIARSLAEGAAFACHETTASMEDDEMETCVATADSQFCAGALLVLEHQEQPNQLMRIAERLGLYDAERLDRAAPVCRSLGEFVAHHGDGEDDDDETPCCCICGPGCEAPAGYLVNGVVVPAEEPGEVYECPGCGEPVCGSCSDSEGHCEYCAEYARTKAGAA